ncbi:toxin secretion/phage lysis holin [Pilibacter termitis]|uniref:Toxin secretion/phage lysis holin n=1 Tax=Pilibacter termitis TaxID=263852 RepID=A0A1T4PF17_9ENTE|nr:phage holin family protein [Pilibacter termitis]SJZ90150.1 toxin secretion/phage lysis holin [Pilibacter termitis]
MNINIDLTKQFLGVDFILILVFSMAILDILIGFWKAWALRTFDSNIAKKGIVSHIGICLLVPFMHFSLKFYGVVIIAYPFELFILVSYVISIVESLGECGLKIPKWLLIHLEKIKDDLEDGKLDGQNSLKDE